MDEDKVMERDKLQSEYQKFLSDLQEKGFCDEQDRVRLLEYFDRVDGLK